VQLSDVNVDVIGCYRMVRDDVEGVIRALRALEAGHRADGARHFYAVRDGQFNELRRDLQASSDPAGGYTPALAAMLIYLNRTGYNGLFRLNSRGAFNVPAGRYASVTICDAPNLRRLAAALRRPGLTLEVRSFEEALARGAPGDFVYLDPPYAPVSRTAHFTSYTAAKFGPEEQATLQRAVVGLARLGARVLLSNSVAPDIRRLYADNPEARAAGLKATTVPARRAINSEATRRGAVREYLITNIV
jgi:DNA adenine methylase